MSFCQNHRNHHCVHDHNCTNHSHKQALKNHAKSKAFREVSGSIGGTKNLHRIAEENEQEEQCHFNSRYDDVHTSKKCSSCHRMGKQLDAKNQQFQQLRKQNSQVQKKYTKACDENRQLQAVIQYYREELDRIVKCGQLDLKNQIKRHLKQNTQLKARNKFLLTKLNDMSELLQKLTSQAGQTEKQLASQRKQRHQITSNFNKLLEKLKKIQSEEANKESESEAEKKRRGQTQTKYQIIIQEINRNLENSGRENKKLFNQNKQLTKNVEILKQKLVNSEKLSKMEQEASNEKQLVLKKKLEGCQREVKQLRQAVAKLEQALKLKQEELLFSKKVVQKQLRIIKENKQIFEQVKTDVDAHYKGNQTGLEEIKDFENRETKKSDDQLIQLRGQIKMLKEKIATLENKEGGHTSQTIQQYIMTIGASEAFRRIIQQKNAYIKKLIREKGALLQKI